jgi:hypothetical protein
MFILPHAKRKYIPWKPPKMDPILETKLYKNVQYISSRIQCLMKIVWIGIDEIYIVAIPRNKPQYYNATI